MTLGLPSIRIIVICLFAVIALFITATTGWPCSASDGVGLFALTPIASATGSFATRHGGEAPPAVFLPALVVVLPGDERGSEPAARPEAPQAARLPRTPRIA